MTWLPSGGPLPATDEQWGLQVEIMQTFARCCREWAADINSGCDLDPRLRGLLAEHLVKTDGWLLQGVDLINHLRSKD